MWLRLFCFGSFRACPGQLLGYAICKEGYPKNPKKKVALASPARIHVDEMDVCEIPIGRDDTGRSAVWLLYREWPYRRKMTRQKCAKTRVKWQILPEWGVPWSFCLQTWFVWVKSYASDDYEVRFEPNICFRSVLNDFDFSFFCYFWGISDTK